MVIISVILEFFSKVFYLNCFEFVHQSEGHKKLTCYCLELCSDLGSRRTPHRCCLHRQHHPFLQGRMILTLQLQLRTRPATPNSSLIWSYMSRCDAISITLAFINPAYLRKGWENLGSVYCVHKLEDLMFSRCANKDISMVWRFCYEGW